MNGLPEPYEPGRDRVMYRGKQYMVSDRAPNADGWRYIGTPCDLAGGDVHFSHEEATLVVKSPAVSGLLKLAGLDPDVYAAEIAALQSENIEPDLSPLEELLSVVEGIARRGHAELRAALIIYREETS